MKKEIIAVTLATVALGLSTIGNAAEDKMRSKSSTLTTAQQNCKDLNEKRAAAGKQALNCDDNSKTAAGKDNRVKESIAPMQK